MTHINISDCYHSTGNLGEVLLLPLFEEERKKMSSKCLEVLSRVQKRAVRNVLKTIDIKLSTSSFLPVFSSEKTVILFFLGKKEGFTTRLAREAGEKVAGIAKQFQQEKISVAHGSLGKKEKKTQSFWKAYLEGVTLGTYEFLEYRGQKFIDQQKKSEEKKLDQITFLVSDGAEKNQLEEFRLQNISEGVKFTKDLINIPPSIATPEFVSQKATELFAPLKNVKTSVLEEKELKKLGAGGILGVGQAGTGNSRFLVVEYAGGKKGDAPLGFVGKGVTYDTGGLSLKPARYMAGMKQDLGGCATVLGGMYVIASTGVEKNVVAVTPLAENLVSRDSYKPDDVVTMMNEKTVEIVNTDAEGRLLLGDALCYIEQTFSPKYIVDLATLTGACAYAVGNDFTAALGTDKNLVDTVLSSSKNVDEPVWELPLHAQYDEFLKSPIADLLNSTQGTLKAGTIEAALFLKNFVSEKTPWCHLDIASVAFDEGKKMATGRNVRLLLDIAKNI